jgi:hypothetical protein
MKGMGEWSLTMPLKVYQIESSLSGEKFNFQMHVHVNYYDTD